MARKSICLVWLRVRDKYMDTLILVLRAWTRDWALGTDWAHPEDMPVLRSVLIRGIGLSSLNACMDLPDFGC